jgi:hypothetical protein
MAKQSITNVSSSNTFQVWLDKTNEVVDLVKNDILTASLASAAGDTTIGNATLVGNFTANTVIADVLLRTDNISPKVGSTVIVATAPVNITTNQTVLNTLTSTNGPRTAFTDTFATWQIGFENTTNKNFAIVSPSSGNVFRITSGGDATITGSLTATSFTGSLTGSVTGNVTGNLSGNVTGNVTGNLTGNAATASALQTPRTIGGVSFDGSANINLPGVNQTGNQNTTGSAASLTTPRNFTIGSTARSFNGTAPVAWSLADIGAQASSEQLTSLASLNTNGIVARTAANTVLARSITGTANQITVTDGNGVSGNPTIAAVIADQVEAETGTNNVKLMTALRTAQAIATLSPKLEFSSVIAIGGTFVDVPIPTTAREVTVNFIGVTANSALPLVRLLVNNNPVTTGYFSSSGTSGAETFTTTGFVVYNDGSRVFHGMMNINRVAAGIWVESHSLTCGGADANGGGSISGVGTVNGIRLTTNGPVLSGGSIVVSWR